MKRFIIFFVIASFSLPLFFGSGGEVRAKAWGERWTGTIASRPRWHKIPHITPETPENVKVKNLAIDEVKIDVKIEVHNVGLAFLQFDRKPTWVGTKPTGTIYKYIDILSENIKNEEIENVTIEFKVEKSWVSEERIDENTIMLHKYAKGEWQPLQIKKIHEDKYIKFSTTSFELFSATSPGLSTFAVAGKKLPPEQPSEGLPWSLIIGIIAATILVLYVILLAVGYGGKGR